MLTGDEMELSCSLGRNYIPSGRQLHRTPLSEVKKHLHFSNGESDESLEKPQEETMEGEAGTTGRDKSDPSGTCDHLNSMLKGMKGYELTESDLEFIKKMKEETLLKKQQQELDEVQRLLEQEESALEQACAFREMARAQMNKLPSCEELMEWAHVVLKTSPESTDLTAKSLLAMVTQEKVQSAMNKKRIVISRMQKTLANREKKAAKHKQQLEKEIAYEQLQIQVLMNELSDLRQKQEAGEASEIQIKSKEEKHKGKPAEKSQKATNLKVAPALGGEQAQNIGPRRSKRIASKN